MASMEDNNIDQNKRYRFLEVAREPCIMLSPLEALRTTPLRRILKAIEPLIEIVVDIQKQVNTAIENAETLHDSILSIDESAAITLYTMEWEVPTNSVYYILNNVLREQNRPRIVPWLSYLKLLLSGLARLPMFKRHVYCGVLLNNREMYRAGQMITWWGFSSCSPNENVAISDVSLADRTEKTLFNIKCLSGKEISNYSFSRNEKEVLLLPGSTFKVVRCECPNGLYTIHLKQVEAESEFILSNIDDTFSQMTDRRLKFDPIRKFFNRLRLNTHSTIESDISRLQDGNNLYLYCKTYTLTTMLNITEAVTKHRIPILALKGTHIEPEATRHIGEYLGTNETLVELYINNIPITDEGADFIGRKLANSNNLTLTWLSLNSCHITDAGAKSLATMLGTNPTLKHLCLSSNEIGDDGIQELVKELKINRNLEELSLEWNMIKESETIDEIIEMLAINRTLLKLNLHVRYAPSSSVKKLKNAVKDKKKFTLITH